MRLTTEKSDAEVSRVSGMGGSWAFDGFDPPYTGNGFTKSTDPVVPDSSLAPKSEIADGAEIWSVMKDGTQVLDAVYRDSKGWVKVQ